MIMSLIFLADATSNSKTDTLANSIKFNFEVLNLTELFKLVFLCDLAVRASFLLQHHLLNIHQKRLLVPFHVHCVEHWKE